MGTLCDCDQVPLEQYEIVRAERDAMKDTLIAVTKSLRAVLAIQDPKSASSHQQQASLHKAQSLIVEVERLVGRRPNGANGTNGANGV